MKTKNCVQGILLLALVSTAARANHPCSSPLILDLDGDGIHTTGIFYPVDFDINADGHLDRIGWTNRSGEDAFLWIDLNQNRTVDDGGELFGDSSRLPSGELPSNGFEALRIYDQRMYGGDQNGLIDRRDFVWHLLRLWIDSNHDGRSQADEIFRLNQKRIRWIALEYADLTEIDGGANLHWLQGRFGLRIRQLGRWRNAERDIEDVIFATAPHHEP